MDHERALHEKVKLALCDFFVEDDDLLQRNVNERSITHKLAEYLQRQFEGLKVDCEYNRRGKDPKTLQKRIFPDIIVHDRGDSDNNRLVIEVKKSAAGPVTRDEEKLRGLTSSDGYHYTLGLLLVFDVVKRQIKFAECFQLGESNECSICKDLSGFGGN